MTALPTEAGITATFESIRQRCHQLHALTVRFRFNDGFYYRVNDPSAGSPTETLLRLLLPLSDKVYLTFRDTARSRAQSERFTGPLEIGRSDGRCVQRAGT